MKKVVIDGATSMLGIALINECIENHIQVLAIVRENSNRIDRIPDSELVWIAKCHLEDLKNFETTGIEDGYEVYYHFAWENTSHEGRLDAIVQNQNVQYTLDAVCLAKRLGCRMFIGAGSQAEYGRAAGMIGPEAAVNPEVAYGVAKYASGKMAMILCTKLGMACIWTRIFSVYGIGDATSTLIMYAIEQLIKGKKPSFTKAEQKWDYLFCRDAGKAFRLIGEKGKAGSIYCLGSGVARPLCDYIYKVRDEINPDLPLGIGDMEYAPLQVMHLQADITTLKKDTGFEPEYSFEEGIRETISWYRKQYKI